MRTKDLMDRKAAMFGRPMTLLRVAFTAGPNFDNAQSRLFKLPRLYMV